MKTYYKFISLVFLPLILSIVITKLLNIPPKGFIDTILFLSYCTYIIYYVAPKVIKEIIKNN